MMSNQTFEVIQVMLPNGFPAMVKTSDLIGYIAPSYFKSATAPTQLEEPKQGFQPVPSREEPVPKPEEPSSRPTSSSPTCSEPVSSPSPTFTELVTSVANSGGGSVRDEGIYSPSVPVECSLCDYNFFMKEDRFNAIQAKGNKVVCNDCNEPSHPCRSCAKPFLSKAFIAYKEEKFGDTYVAPNFCTTCKELYRQTQVERQREIGRTRNGNRR